ncbi:hypothetical protein Tco_0586563 [Tanacetum coccineum]
MAYQRQLITRKHVMINSRSDVSTTYLYAVSQLFISQRYAFNVIDGLDLIFVTVQLCNVSQLENPLNDLKYYVLTDHLIRRIHQLDVAYLTLCSGHRIVLTDTAYRLSDTVPVFRIRISVLLSVFSPPRAHPTDYFALDNRLQGPYTNTKPNGTFDRYLDTDCMPEKNYNANNARNVQEGQGYMENLACKTSACKIRKFEMMKYTFEADEEYVAIKELINHSETNKDARSA